MQSPQHPCTDSENMSAELKRRLARLEQLADPPAEAIDEIWLTGPDDSAPCVLLWRRNRLPEPPAPTTD